jgi:hypothetical protein
MIKIPINKQRNKNGRKTFNNNLLNVKNTLRSNVFKKSQLLEKINFSFEFVGSGSIHKA